MKNKSEIKLNVIFTEEENGGYSVQVPQLPGCFSEGDTFEEARKNIVEAITLYMEDMAEEEEVIQEIR